MSKPVSIRTYTESADWKKVLSVYTELFRNRVFSAGSNVYDRMMKISLAVQKYDSYNR